MKTDNINIRITPELRDEFYKFCDKKCITPSKLVRSWMIDFVQDAQLEEVRFYPNSDSAHKDAVERGKTGLTGGGQTCGPEYFEAHGWTYKTWDDRYLVPGGELPDRWLEKYQGR